MQDRNRGAIAWGLGLERGTRGQGDKGTLTTHYSLLTTHYSLATSSTSKSAPHFTQNILNKCWYLGHYAGISEEDLKS